MTKKSVKMMLSDKAYKRFQTSMKKMDFKNEDHFLKYCVLKTIKPKLTDNQKIEVNKEIKLLKDSQNQL